MKRSIAEPYSYKHDPAVPDFPNDHPIIIFDGHCVLCSRWAQFVIRHDPDKVFRLLAAQTPLGHALYEHYGLNPVDYQTNILVADGKAWFKSEGSIRIFEELGAPWSAVRIIRLLPTALRDGLYSLVARNRLRWFGSREICFAPSSEIKEHFLE